MPKLTAQEATEKQARRLKSSIEDMRMGAERVSVSPTAEAAKKLDKMKMNFNKAIDDGKVSRGLNRVSKEEWQRKYINKGLPRVAVGIDEAAPKVTAFYEEFFPYLEGVQNEVKRMPDITLEDNINRMTTAVRKLAQFKRTR